MASKGLNYFALCEMVVDLARQGRDNVNIYADGVDLGPLYLQTEDNPLLSLAEFLSTHKPNFSIEGPYAYRCAELAVPELAAVSHLLK